MFGTTHGSKVLIFLQTQAPNTFYKSNRTVDIEFYHPKADMGYNEGMYKVAIVLQ